MKKREIDTTMLREQNKKLLKKGSKTLGEFKEFIARGNVVDLAVGVIIGNAFSKIVTSVVNDILTPALGVFIGGVDFSNLSFKFQDATIAYGKFIQSVIDFLIVAVCIFIFVKIISSLTKKKEKEESTSEPTPPPVKPDDILLLEEIRDILKSNTKESKKK